MTPIAMGFSYRPGNLLSWIIRKATNAPISHCWLLVSDPVWGLMVIEAGEVNVDIASYKNFILKNKVVYLGLLEGDMTNGMKALKGWMDESYDYMGLIGMAWVELGDWIQRKLKNPFVSSTSMFCSELITRFMQAIPYKGFESMIPDSASPKALLAAAGSCGITLIGPEQLDPALQALI